MFLALIVAMPLVAAPADRFSALVNTLHSHADSDARVAALNELSSLPSEDATRSDIEGAVASALADRGQRGGVRARAVELLVELDTTETWQALRVFGEALPEEIEAAETEFAKSPELLEQASTRAEREAAVLAFQEAMAWRSTARDLRRSLLKGLAQRRSLPEARVILLLSEDPRSVWDLEEGLRALLAQDLRPCLVRAIDLTIEFERRHSEALATLARVRKENPGDDKALAEARLALHGFDADLGVLKVEFIRFTRRHGGMAPPPERPWTRVAWDAWGAGNLELVPAKP